MGTKHYFAIRLGNYLELRVAAKPPKALTSKLTKTITKQRQFISWADGKPKVVWQPYKETLTLKQTVFLGGRSLGIVKYHKALLTLPTNSMMEVSKDIKTFILTRKQVKG